MQNPYEFGARKPALYYSSGFPSLLESPGFIFVKFPGPGKWVWSWKVLEILVKGPGNMQMPKLAQILSVYTKKIAGGRCSAPNPIVTAVCFYI